MGLGGPALLLHSASPPTGGARSKGRSGRPRPAGGTGECPAPRSPCPVPRAPCPAPCVTGSRRRDVRGPSGCIAHPQEPAEPNVAPSSLGAPRCAPSRGSPLTPRACVHPHLSPRDKGDGSVHHWLVSSAGVTGPSWRPGASRSPGAAGKKTLPAPVGPDPLMPPPCPSRALPRCWPRSAQHPGAQTLSQSTLKCSPGPCLWTP